jgi:hypothetical protein
MFGSQNTKTDIILAIYKENRSVFRLKDIAMITGISDFQSLNKKLNYYVHKGKLMNPRKGIYTKPDYNQEELACSIYTPAYISLEYVLQKAGIIFQYDNRVTVVSYLSRSIIVDEKTYSYRKLKGDLLIDTTGIVRQNNFINVASAERAFMDMLYLDKDYYFDNLNPLNKELIGRLLPIYQSEVLTRRVTKLMQNG